MIRSGFPNSYLAKTDAASIRWRNDFIKTFLERDVPQLGISIPAMTIRRFWTMTAHFHGQIWNAAEFARSQGSIFHKIKEKFMISRLDTKNVMEVMFRKLLQRGLLNIINLFYIIFSFITAKQ